MKHTAEEIVQGCLWKDQFCGSDICAGECMPCRKAIREGRCAELLKKYYSKENEDDDGTT